MKISCPVCFKEKNKGYGKYLCSDCKSKFEYTTDHTIVLIKRNKFDYWTFLLVLTISLMLVTLISIEIIKGDINKLNNIPFGLLLIFYPVLIAIRQLFNLGHNDVTLIDLYFMFFKKELRKQDIGRIIGFYLTFSTNLAGLLLIIISLVI